MLDQISKALGVVGELKTLPATERAWLLAETKRHARVTREAYEEQFLNTSDPTEQFKVMQRIETLRVAERLLSTINLRG